MVNNKTKSKGTSKRTNKLSKNTIIMKVLVFLGVIILSFVVVYLMNYFFIEHNDIKINMSTEKKLEYLQIDGSKKLITTKKYVSDLNYSMRYDVDNFTVFKYHSQDFYKYNDEEKIIVIVEKSSLPDNCIDESESQKLIKCTLTIDDFTEENYFSQDKNTYKITIKNPNTNNYNKNVKPFIDYMLNSFEFASK